MLVSMDASYSKYSQSNSGEGKLEVDDEHPEKMDKEPPRMCLSNLGMEELFNRVFAIVWNK